MSNEAYDVLIIGPISIDINIDFEGNVLEETGGAVVQSSFAAMAGGNRTAVFTKASARDKALCSVFNVSAGNLFFMPSKATTSIKNQYFTNDKERRVCTPLGICDPFRLEEFPRVKAKIFHFAGLVVNDFSPELITETSKNGKVAVDAQAFVRHVTDGKMEFHDWKEKKELLPFITYFKADEVEARILTGMDDRYEAAKQLYCWGAREIMISHHTEIIVYDGKRFYTCPIKARNLSGRTGRGDTVFAAYITERLRKMQEESLLYATAAVSLKMETPSPFKGTRVDVEKYIANFYSA